MEHVFIIFVALIRTALGKAIRSLRRRIRRLFKRRWPEVQARIEVVSVFELPEPSHFVKTYVGNLTYFYRNPDLHTGDYAVEFGTQIQAEWWAQPFKGRQVMVRVNPRDAEDSVLLELPTVPAMRPRAYVPSGTQAVSSVRKKQVVRAEVLTEAQRTLAEYARLVSIAGVGASLVVLSLSLASGGRSHSPTIFWLGLALLALLLASVGELSFHVTRSHRLRTLLRFYGGWCPARARVLLGVSAPILVYALLLTMDQMQIPAQGRAMIWAHLPYLAGLWGFMASWALHTAILRSQRNAETGNEHQRSMG